MRIELDENELVQIIREWCLSNIGTEILSGKDIIIASKSYHALAAVVTIEPAPLDDGGKGE